MTWNDTPITEWDRPGHVSAGAGFNELDTALARGIMPHEWFAAPRWSRVLALATTRIRGKLDYIAMKEGAKDSKSD